MGKAGGMRDAPVAFDDVQRLKLADTFFSHSVSCLMILDRDFNFVRVNQAYADACRRDINDFAGRNHFVLFPSDAKDIFDDVVRNKRPFATFSRAFEYADQPERGVTYWDWTLVPVLDGDGDIEYLVCSLVEVTERKRTEETLRIAANFDSLTGLPNRRQLLDKLRGLIAGGVPAGPGLALLLIDLDQFKEINDTLGHDIGDALLVVVARRLAAAIPDGATVARLGGDEFAVLMPTGADALAAATLAQALIDALAAPIRLGVETLFVSASVGIALHPQHGANSDLLLRHADQAMYAAKNGGRNRYRLFAAAMEEAALLKMSLTNDLRNAIAGNEFEVYYQPIVTLGTITVDKAEALLRWHHPQRGMVPPVEFIALAEASGLIIEIGDWVFRQAAQQVQRLRRLGHSDFQISVNVSPVQFHNVAELGRHWSGHLAELGLPASSIVVEITEGLLLDLSAEVKTTLLALADAGIQVALDDFGTGYSALAYLRKFDIDFLKIDRAFVRNLDTDANDRTLCEAIIAMAHTLGLKVIAEGVETADQRDMLTAAGCDYAQGYLFSTPVPGGALETLLLA